MKLAGRHYTKEEILTRVGSLAQIGGVERAVLQEGKAQGLEVLEVRTGTPLTFTVLPGRALDIGRASWAGLPLAWLSPTGYVAAPYFEPQGTGFLRSFGGGLLTTCGLTYLGAPCRDEGEELGLHGRIANTPAEQVAVTGEWVGDDYELRIGGVVREAALFGPNLVLRRELRVRLGEARVFLRDIVENEGFTRTPHMFLYHMNLGFPLLDGGTELLLPPHRCQPRDAEAAKGLDAYTSFSTPVPGFQEQVFYHEVTPPAAGEEVAVRVHNPHLCPGREGKAGGLTLTLKYRPAELPRLIEWKLVAQGAYVLGIEPANCWVGGRAQERAQGTLIFLEPGERREYHLEIEVSAS